MPQENRYIVRIFYYYDDNKDPEYVYIPYRYTLKSIDEYFTKQNDACDIINENPKAYEAHFGKDYDKNRIEIHVYEEDVFGNYTMELEPLLYKKDAKVLDVKETNSKFKEYLNDRKFIVGFIMSVIKYCDSEASKKLLGIANIILEKKEYDTLELQTILDGLSDYVFDRAKYIYLKEYENKENPIRKDSNETYGENVIRFSNGNGSDWIPPKKQG